MYVWENQTCHFQNILDTFKIYQYRAGKTYSLMYDTLKMPAVYQSLYEQLN